jgi:hypothetical protein
MMSKPNSHVDFCKVAIGGLIATSQNFIYNMLRASPCQRPTFRRHGHPPLLYLRCGSRKYGAMESTAAW